MEAQLAQEAVEREIAEFEAEYDAQQAQLAIEKEIAEFEAEYEAQQKALRLAKFQADLEAERAAAAKSTAIYQARLQQEQIIKDNQAKREAKLAEQKAAAEAAAAAAAVVAAHEACKHTLDLKLSASNIALFHSALADGTLFNIGPQITSGTEFTANRWDEYAECVSNYVNPF